jgi:hypothetical protein
VDSCSIVQNECTIQNPRQIPNFNHSKWMNDLESLGEGASGGPGKNGLNVGL